jgi:hypothetical protein
VCEKGECEGGRARGKDLCGQIKTSRRFGHMSSRLASNVSGSKRFATWGFHNRGFSHFYMVAKE